MTFRSIIQQRCRSRFINKSWLPIQGLPQLFCNPLNRQYLRSSYIQNFRRLITMQQAPYSKLVCIALPDYIDIIGTDIDGLVVIHLFGNFQHDTIAKINGITQSAKEHARMAFLPEISEYALSAQCALCILTYRFWWGTLVSTCRMNIHKWQDITGGKGNNAGVFELFCHPTGQIGIHRPGKIRITR